MSGLTPGQTTRFETFYSVFSKYSYLEPTEAYNLVTEAVSRHRNDLIWADVVSVYDLGEVKVRRNGALVISCLFHKENTPSMHLYPSGNYYCYGCGDNGSMTDYITHEKTETYAVLWRLSGNNR